MSEMRVVTQWGNRHTRYPEGATNDMRIKAHCLYLVGRYSRRNELTMVAVDLLDMWDDSGVRYGITSRWLFEDHTTILGLDNPMRSQERSRFAQEDLYDLYAAQTIVVFTEDEDSPYGRGGRHVEYGVIIELMRYSPYHNVIIVGPKENVFHELPIAFHFPTKEAFLAAASDIKGLKEKLRGPQAAYEFRIKSAVEHCVHRLNRALAAARGQHMFVQVEMDDMNFTDGSTRKNVKTRMWRPFQEKGRA